MLHGASYSAVIAWGRTLLVEGVAGPAPGGPAAVTVPFPRRERKSLCAVVGCATAPAFTFRLNEFTGCGYVLSIARLMCSMGRPPGGPMTPEPTSSPRLKAPLTTTLDPLLTVEETAAYTRMHKMTVYRLMAKGSIPFTVIGKRRKVRQSDLEALV